jgi:hypothetical protein
LEYTVCGVLAAVAHAIGNTHHIRIKRDWICSPALYFILVGRPGLGKSPPLKILFRVLYEEDSKRVAEFRQEMKRYNNAVKNRKEGEDFPDKPILRKTMLSDFTPEALVAAHAVNKRGIMVFYDEVMGMLNTVGRYTASNLIEIFLMSFSGIPLDNVRCCRDTPQTVMHPCITLAGTIQTARFNEFLKLGLDDNGFVDRTIFAFPIDAKIEDLRTEDDNEVQSDIQMKWQSIIRSLMEMPMKCNPVNEEPIPNIIRLSRQAQLRLFQWRNEKTHRMNNAPDKEAIDTRPMKLVEVIARIALCLQMLQWSCNGEKLSEISNESIEGAIRLIEYYEHGYNHLRNIIKENDIPPDIATWLKDLPMDFTTAEAVKIADDIGIRERKAKEFLSKYTQNGLLIKVAHGVYRKSYSS